jgi:hypothetical protein
MADVPMKPGFLKYKQEHLRKVNALREAASLVNITSMPIPDKGQVMFSTVADAHNEPRSCHNCWLWNEHPGTCYLMGPSVRAEKFIYPPEAENGTKPIEYWPVCGYWDYGKHNEGATKYKDGNFDDPDNLGFGYVNAPTIGGKEGGTSCGGQGNGDDCDSYIIKGDDKRLAPTGFCRVLQATVENGACCSSWNDDDFINWRNGQKLLEELDSKRERMVSPNPLLGKK